MIKAAYIHIPFCEHICHYCDFNKVFLKGQPVDEYLEFLGKEMRLTLERHPAARLDSVFVGGGTPTALNEKQLVKLCEIIRAHLPYDDGTEYTFEANPGDLGKEKLQILAAFGVNRLSIGVQSFNDVLLAKIGRKHKAEDVFTAVESARAAGFENISIDLIYGLPGQTLADFEETLKIAMSLEIVHCSAYSLIIEPKTVFYHLMKQGKLSLPGEDAEADMYDMLLAEMGRNGFRQYEISNFSLPGYESRHNLTYWNNEHYFGFGAGAHSYLDGVRRSNYGPLKKYLQHLKNNELPVFEESALTKEEMMEEEMFLGLRKISGVNINVFREKFAENPLDIFARQLERLKKKELIDISPPWIRLTKKGLFLGNEAFQEFIGAL